MNVARARLTEDQVRQMFTLRQRGKTLAAIAERYGVAVSTVSCILSGKRWGYLEGTKPRSLTREQAGATKMTSDKVRQVFRLREEGLSMREIATELDISCPNVFQILHRQTWKHVEIE